MSRVLAEHVKNEDIGPSDEEVRQELTNLLSRAEFHASERNRSFLSYIVEETLQGRADRIKAYSIAIAAFDRSDDFDPLTDQRPPASLHDSATSNCRCFQPGHAKTLYKPQPPSGMAIRTSTTPMDAINAPARSGRAPTCRPQKNPITKRQTSSKALDIRSAK